MSLWFNVSIQQTGQHNLFPFSCFFPDSPPQYDGWRSEIGFCMTYSTRSETDLFLDHVLFNECNRYVTRIYKTHS